MRISFSIIGTAFKNDDAKKCSKYTFDALCLVASSLIDQINESNYKLTDIISGGSAGAEFVAVSLFLNKKVPNLKLFLPCEWDDGMFHDNGISGDIKRNPGNIENHYHKKFQTATGINSLSQMQIAKCEGAELIPVLKGFYARNALIAKSDFLLAMTFGNGPEVKDGGTSHCVKCYLDRVKKEGIFDKSFHYDINNGTIHEGCTLSDTWKKDFSKLSRHWHG